MRFMIEKKPKILKLEQERFCVFSVLALYMLELVATIHYAPLLCATAACMPAQFAYTAQVRADHNRADTCANCIYTARS